MFERGPVTFALRVWGQPAGAGSKTARHVRRGDGSLVFKQEGFAIREGRVFGNPVFNMTHQSDKTEPWMELVAGAARKARADQGLKTIQGAVWIAIDCFELRPGSHFTADGRLKIDAPAHPDQTVTHDSGKQRRAIEDALTAASIWADDKRVVDGHDRKHYCDFGSVIYEGEDWSKPRAVIRVGSMLHQTVEEAEIQSPPPPGQEGLAV